jgi:Putative prokaryotic signal transducing protein
MIELIRSDNAVFVSWLEVRLFQLGIKAHVLDGYTSGVYGGALSAVQRRVMIEDADQARAQALLAEAALATGDVASDV